MSPIEKQDGSTVVRPNCDTVVVGAVSDSKGCGHRDAMRLAGSGAYCYDELSTCVLSWGQARRLGTHASCANRR